MIPLEGFSFSKKNDQKDNDRHKNDQLGERVFFVYLRVSEDAIICLTFIEF